MSATDVSLCVSAHQTIHRGGLSVRYPSAAKYLTSEATKRLDQLEVRYDFLVNALGGGELRRRDPKLAVEYETEMGQLVPLIQEFKELKAILNEQEAIRQALVGATPARALKLIKDRDAYNPLLEDQAKIVREEYDKFEKGVQARAKALEARAIRGPVKLDGAVAGFHDRHLAAYFLELKGGGEPNPNTFPWSRYSRVVNERLRELDGTRDLEDLKRGEGRFKFYKDGKFKGYHAIKIDSQFRLLFLWREGRAEGVRIEDYHAED